MHDMDGRFSRRSFAAALAGAAVAGGSRAFAADAPRPTAESPLGPFYPMKRAAEADADLVWLKGHSQKATGTVIEVAGRVLNRHGKPMAGAEIESWQCNAAGRYAHANDPNPAALDPHFQGFAALKTGADGAWRITTIRPPSYPTPIGLRPPHIHFDVRGTNHRLTAQMYFPDEAKANAADQLYQDLRDEAATSVAEADGAGRYRWDIVLMDG
jgi:protocatechuate 3,4-dioxygenase beta subunit